MTSLAPVQCRACTRYRATNPSTCEAFPAGIPVAIIGYGADHREPAEGDHGLRFKQAQTDTGRAAFEQWRSTFGTS